MCITLNEHPDMAVHSMNGFIPYAAWKPLFVEGVRLDNPNCFLHPHAGGNRLRLLYAGGRLGSTGQSGIAVSKGRVGVNA
jgi:hypothetical protein